MRLITSQKNSTRVQSDLIKLWNTVFGDDEEYIKLILPYLCVFDCYAVEENGKIVSAFYLLPCEIKVGEKLFKGKYLYAAATYEECRKKGYMSFLINEALSELKNKIDFISLVPANDGLYSYYARFGFETAMYNVVSKLRCKGSMTNGKSLSAEEVNSLRKEKFNNAHLFTDETMEYALRCYSFFSSEFIEKNSSAILFVNDEKTVYEGIYSEDEKESYIEFLENSFDGEISVVSPYELNSNSQKVKCGMVCAFSDELKNDKNIYMNHTLM